MIQAQTHGEAAAKENTLLSGYSLPLASSSEQPPETLSPPCKRRRRRGAASSGSCASEEVTQAAQPCRVHRLQGGKLAPLPVLGQARPRSPPAAPGGQSCHAGAGAHHVLAAHMEVDAGTGAPGRREGQAAGMGPRSP